MAEVNRSHLELPPLPRNLTLRVFFAKFFFFSHCLFAYRYQMPSGRCANETFKMILYKDIQEQNALSVQNVKKMF